MATFLRSVSARTGTRNERGAATSLAAHEVDPGRSEPGILDEPVPEGVFTEVVAVGALSAAIEPTGDGFQRDIAPSPPSRHDEMGLPGDRPCRIIDVR